MNLIHSFIFLLRKEINMNIAQLQHKIKTFNVTDDTQLEYENLKLQLDNAILRDRLLRCKIANKKRISALSNIIRFFINDFERFHTLDNIKCIYWESGMIIASIIAKMLMLFKKKKEDGVPYDIFEECKNDKVANKYWNDILDKMIFAFQLCGHSDNVNLTEKEKHAKQEGMSLFVKYLDHLWS